MNTIVGERQLRLPLHVDGPAADHSLPEGDYLLDNHGVAQHLDEVADRLERAGANPFRVRAYRKGAEAVRRLARPVGEILDREDLPGLEDVPAIGRSLARSIERLLRTGRLPLLDRLRAAQDPRRLFASIPDIGAELSRRIHEQLGLSSLAELDRAAWDGRLAALPGMGPKRICAVRDALAARLRRPSAAHPTRSEPTDAPPVAELLDIDREYRLRAETNRLPRVAPRRFNPTGQAWLPVWRTRRAERHYTALYCNTVRAHQLGQVRDWVVIITRRASGHGRFLVVTAAYGLLQGRRIVLGRESECAEHYALARSGRKPKPR